MVAEPDQDLNNNPLEAYVALLRSKGASTKDINLRKSVPFVAVAAIALGFALVSSYPPGVLFGLFLVYAASGYVISFMDWRQARAAAKKPVAGGQ